MGTRGKINAIWWNIKINVQKVVDICGYELPINLQNFTQKDLTKVKLFQKDLRSYFFETACIVSCAWVLGWRWLKVIENRTIRKHWYDFMPVFAFHSKYSRIFLPFRRSTRTWQPPRHTAHDSKNRVFWRNEYSIFFHHRYIMKSGGITQRNFALWADPLKPLLAKYDSVAYKPLRFIRVGVIKPASNSTNDEIKQKCSVAE